LGQNFNIEKKLVGKYSIYSIFSF